MTKFVKTLALGLGLAVLGGNAHAATDTFETRFLYDEFAPVEVNYANFQRTAKLACKAEIRSVGKQPLTVRGRYMHACQDQLMTRVIEATRIDVLIAYHNARKTILG